ncbi:MAG: hypothetical protein APF77_19680 [Clostridia bacterium BRH_c25]|nr:MAG: hypothetical protein APF77_19680 [Clostridia bacterium BRH_c25]
MKRARCPSHLILAEKQGGAVLEKYSVDKNDLKHCIVSKVDELVECVQKLGKAELFQITVKYINGELITSTDFLDLKTLG